MPGCVVTVIRDWLHAQVSLQQLAQIDRDQARAEPGRRFNAMHAAAFINAVRHFEDLRQLCGETLAQYVPAANEATLTSEAQ